MSWDTTTSVVLCISHNSFGNFKYWPGLNYCVPVGTFTVKIYFCVDDQLPHWCNHSIMLSRQKFQFLIQVLFQKSKCC